MITRLDTTSYNFIHMADDSLNLFLSIKYFIVIPSKVRKVALQVVVVVNTTCKYYEYVVLRTVLVKSLSKVLALQNPAETLVGGFVEFIRFYTSNTVLVQVPSFFFLNTFGHLVLYTISPQENTTTCFTARILLS